MLPYSICATSSQAPERSRDFVGIGQGQRATVSNIRECSSLPPIFRLFPAVADTQAGVGELGVGTGVVERR